MDYLSTNINQCLFDFTLAPTASLAFVTNGIYGPFNPSHCRELTHSEAEIIWFDGVQVAIHLTRFAH